MEETEGRIWYAMRATYRRSLNAKLLLEELGISSFIPMRYELITQKARKKRVLVPAIQDLIFVHTTPTVIKKAKAGISYLQYLTNMEQGKRTPIVVPDFQMRQFIAVAQTHDDQLIYLEPSEVKLSKGTNVRIHGGVFDGVEGVFIKVKGVKKKRIVVSIPGITSVVVAEISPDLIEVI
ncbi:MAG: UpxY family transcription antiterminator [Mangrovibacterium sp.]